METITNDISDTVADLNVSTGKSEGSTVYDFNVSINITPNQITIKDLENKLLGVKDSYKRKQILMNTVNNDNVTQDARKRAAELHTLENKKTIYAYANLEELSSKDSLTKIWNHGYFQDQLTAQISQTRRNSVKNKIQENKSLTLLLVDIDNFKRYNDTKGHQEGDRILYEVAQIAKKYSRGVACRYGGEEFAVILPETTPDEGMTAGQRLVDEIRTIGVTISVGMANYTNDIQDQHNNKKFKRDILDIKTELIEKADKAMYAAKKRGKNRIEAYSQIK